MSVSRRAMLVAGAAALPAICTIPVFGQPADAHGGASADQQLGTWMMADGFKQIEVSKPVTSKATADAVKAFAAAEIKEHEDMKAKLTAKGITPLVPIGAPAAAGADAHQAGGMLALAFKSELAAQCVASTNEAMAQKEGAEYDVAYVTHQLIAHMELKDTVTVAMKHASADVKPILQEAMGVIDTHLATLKELKKSMKA